MSKISGFKGFDKDLKCRDFQYEIGKTFTHEGPVSLCNRGFHFCENPLDVLSFYGVAEGNRYGTVEAVAVSDESEKDSKRVAKSLHIKAEISLSHLIGAGVKFIFNKTSTPTSGNSAHSATSGNYAHSATSGNSAHSATSGNYAHSATSGDSANSATSGYSAHSATSGYSAHSATSGDYAHSATSGDYAHSATSGNYAHSATSGNSANSATSGYAGRASVMGKNAVAAAISAEGAAKAAEGNWIVCAEWKDGKPINVKSAKVDGKKIKANTFYKLQNGKFVEVAK